MTDRKYAISMISSINFKLCYTKKYQIFS